MNFIDTQKLLKNRGPDANSRMSQSALRANTRVASAAALEQKSPSAAFFWLSAFYFVYCSRPEDWIPGLSYVPLAKISGIFAVVGLFFSIGKAKRSLHDLPREAMYLLAITALLIPSALLSPIWKGGAFFRGLDFSKVFIAWVLTFLLVTDFSKLRRIIFIQTGSVAVISIVSLLKGRSSPRLEGVLGGIYSNPNDLAFAIVLSLPFCFAFMLSARGGLRKLLWGVVMLLMLATVFLTGSRGGFITLLVAGIVALWHFGVKGRRWYLIAATVLAGVLLFSFEGNVLVNRFVAIGGGSDLEGYQHAAYGSYEQRKQLMERAIEGIEHYPVFGIGMHNFPNYSGNWHDVHMTYLQIAVEVGIPAMVLYLLFFGRGFSNLRNIRKVKNLDPEISLFVGALHSSLVGFVIGACFAPEAYEYFPYFAIAYTSALLAMMNEKEPGVASQPASLSSTLNKSKFVSRSSPNQSVTGRNPGTRVALDHLREHDWK